MSESKGIKSKLIPKIATGFCGGVSHTDGICGAISGGILAINMMCGRSNTTDLRNVNSSKVQKLIKSFNEKFESTQCYELTSCNLGTEKGQEKYNRNECNTLCDNFVAEATQITMDLIDQ